MGRERTRPRLVAALLAAPLAYDHDLRRDEAFGTEANIDRAGFEAEVFRLIALRVGYLSDPECHIQGVTFGGGVTLPIGPWASASYQLAREPLADDLDPRLLQVFSLWVDPTRIWADTQPR